MVGPAAAAFDRLEVRSIDATQCATLSPGLVVNWPNARPFVTDFLSIRSSTMPTIHKARTAAGVKRRGGTSPQGAAPGAPDAMLVALGTKFEALSAELAALQKGKVALFSPYRRARRTVEG